MNEILIDVDGSPRGYVAWYNHSTNNSMIRTTRSLPKNIKFGVQRAEMIAIYYALKDNIELFLSGKISEKRKYVSMLGVILDLQLNNYKESQELETKNCL